TRTTTPKTTSNPTTSSLAQWRVSGTGLSSVTGGILDAPPSVVGDTRVGLDGVVRVGFSRCEADDELRHHVVVLVGKVVAVDHVPALVGAELHDQPDGLVLAR